MWNLSLSKKLEWKKIKEPIAAMSLISTLVVVNKTNEMINFKVANKNLWGFFLEISLKTLKKTLRLRLKKEFL